jgi:hypothetical protein
VTRIEPLALEPILHVARNMREEDRREIIATRWMFEPDQIAQETFALARFGCVAHANPPSPNDPSSKGLWPAGRSSGFAQADMPVAVVAAIECWPGFYSVGMFATDAWPEVACSLTRWARRRMAASLLAAGAHRMECRTIEGHETAHRWLERLGAVREAVMPDMGRNRETFYLYAWRLSDVSARIVLESQAAAAAPAAAPAGAERG